MSPSMDASRADSQAEHESFIGKIASNVVDFGEGLYRGAIESPIDGAVQLTNHIFTGSHIPELHLVDEERLSHSTGGVLGNIAGNALDMYALSVATAGVAGVVGGSSVMAGALRFGAVGALYTAALQPTDAKSDHFFQDRLGNGAVALGTFAAMGAAGTAIDSLPFFKVPALRSLAGNLVYGGLVGTAGGVANAEATAVIKQGQDLPNGDDLLKDVGTYAAFGMAYGAANFAFNKLTPPSAKTFSTDRGILTVQSDAQGNAVRIAADSSPLDYPDTKLTWHSTKMTNGTWQTTADGDFIPPTVASVKIDGNQLTISGGGVALEYTNGGVSKEIDLQAQAYSAQHKGAGGNPRFKTENVGGMVTERSYSSNMRLRSMTQSPANIYGDGPLAFVFYGRNDSIESISVDPHGMGNASFDIKNEGAGNWSVQGEKIKSIWQGDVKVVPPTAPGQLDQIMLTPKNGSPLYVNLFKGMEQFSELLDSTGQKLLRK